MVGLICVLVAGIAAALSVYLQLCEAAELVNQAPAAVRSPSLVGESQVTLAYRFSGFEPVPEGADVTRQYLEVSAGSLPIRPVIPMRLDATEITISVPRNSEIEVVRCWEDDAGNVSRAEPLRFRSKDTIAPPSPLPLGKPELIAEDD